MDRIRAGIAQIPIADLGLTSLTSSFGLSELLPGDHTLVDLLGRADSPPCPSPCPERRLYENSAPPPWVPTDPGSPVCVTIIAANNRALDAQ
ncbi:MAG TPA: hypothetical protein VH250_02055 [Granulicella sp.]|nr:hypothetical protein [Granulicella sp.]